MNMTKEARQAAAQLIATSSCSPYVKKMIIWLMTVQAPFMPGYIQFPVTDPLVRELAGLEQKLNGEKGIGLNKFLESLDCPNRINFQGSGSAPELHFVNFLAFGPVGARHGTLYRHGPDLRQQIEREVVLPS